MIKSTTSETHDEIIYPCLMKSETEIVLFCSEGSGSVVHQYENCNSDYAKHSTEWYMPAFKTFKGTLTLENK